MATHGLILAAGRGSRMGSLTSSCHKSLLQFNGKSLLDWQVLSMNAADIHDIAIVSGYLGGQVARKSKINFFNDRWFDTNMLYSLRSAMDILMSSDCIVSYSDIIYSPDMLLPLANSTEDLCIGYDPNWKRLWDARFDDIYEDAETFRTENNLVVEIGHKLHSHDQIDGQYIGLFKTTPAFWNWCAKNIHDDLYEQMDMTEFFSYLINQHNYNIRAVELRGEWFEFDIPTDFSAAHKYLSSSNFFSNS